MKAVTAQTMQAIDSEAINSFGIPGLQLMETAGSCCVEVIESIYGHAAGRKVVIMAGRGNNGGDGFVIARMLLQQGWQVRVFLLTDADRIQGDALANLKRLSTGTVVCCSGEQPLTRLVGNDLKESDLIVDAMLGTGLNCDVAGIYAEAIELVNSSGRPVFSVDIPSGVNATTGRIMGSAIRADHTVTFAAPKIGQIIYPGTLCCGELSVADIGIPPEILQKAHGYVCLDAGCISSLIRPRHRQAHKGHFGHCLILAGSTGKSGAAALCANSAVRAGAGLVTLAAPSRLNAILEVKTTEAMTLPLEDTGDGHCAEKAFERLAMALSGKSVLGVGPGIGRHPETVMLVRRLVEQAHIPLVIDADGLNAVAVDTSVLLRKRSGSIILTPHPGEMARLSGHPTPEYDWERIQLAADFAAKYGVWLVLKGARTIIASPDGAVAINTSGNPGMASGGMGDVLTGTIAALCGQGYTIDEACRIGVFIHGMAADLVAEEKGETGITATDVIEKLPYAFKELGTRNEE